MSWSPEHHLRDQHSVACRKHHQEAQRRRRAEEDFLSCKLCLVKLPVFTGHTSKVARFLSNNIHDRFLHSVLSTALVSCDHVNITECFLPHVPLQFANNHQVYLINNTTPAKSVDTPSNSTFALYFYSLKKTMACRFSLLEHFLAWDIYCTPAPYYRHTTHLMISNTFHKWRNVRNFTNEILARLKC